MAKETEQELPLHCLLSKINITKNEFDLREKCVVMIAKCIKGKKYWGR